jgi:hypothetical protein
VIIALRARPFSRGLVFAQAKEDRAPENSIVLAVKSRRDRV